MKLGYIIGYIVAVFFTSCSMSEFDYENNKNHNIISFTATTTRAAISILASLEGAKNGFTVFAVSPLSDTEWHSNVDGTNNNKHTAGVWGWANTNAHWPTTNSGYPMSFYAYYPPFELGSYKYIIEAASNLLIGAVDVPTLQSDQEDIIVAEQIGVLSKPFDGKLPLSFKHILSKVNMGIIAGDSVTAYVQKAWIENVRTTRNFDLTSGTWAAGDASGNLDYNYYFADIFPLINHIATGSSTENMAIPFYAGNHTNNLMLVPQTTIPWIPTVNVEPSMNYSFIGLVYRLKGAQNNIGYAEARNYLTDNPGYADISGWTNEGITYTGIKSGINPYGNRPLYVKVGFPLAATWASGKAYTYNILLGTAGSSNGYLLSKYYFDDCGADTGLPIGKNVGVHISDGKKNFNVLMPDWDNNNLPL